MRTNRWTLGWIIILVILLVGPNVPAQEPEPDAPEEPVEQPADMPAEAENVPWWGGKNMLYVEFGYGSSSFDEINASLEGNSGLGFYSSNRFSIEEADQGTFAVGWALPYDRGRFLVSFNGLKETSYEFDAAGQRSVLWLAPNPEFYSLPFYVDWWRVHAEDGNMAINGYSPEWDFADDDPVAGRVGKPDSPEVRLETYANDSFSAPRTFQNRLQTWDGLFEREWGGRRCRGRWTAGARYFTYEGNVPIAAWLSVSSSDGHLVYGDGVVARPLSLRQETTGIGPTSSLEAQFRFFRDRLVIYGNARFAFLLQSNDVDTGVYSFYVEDSQNLVATAVRSTKTVDKSVWQLEAEVGARIRIYTGTHLTLAYRQAGYGDALLLPVTMTIPEFAARIPQGVTFLYNTRDLRFSTVRAGLSYQF